MTAQTLSRFHPGVQLRRLYDWVVSWAETRYANTALFLIAFAEASFFPMPPDVLLIAMGVGAPKKSLRFAAVCLVGSVLGGILGYLIGYGIWQATSHLFFSYVPGFTPALFENVVGMFQGAAFWAIFAAGFTPIPYKVFTIAAGVAEIDITTFVVASIASRGLRFFVIAGMLRMFGAPIKAWIEKYFNIAAVIFTVLLVGGFVAIKMVLH